MRWALLPAAIAALLALPAAAPATSSPRSAGEPTPATGRLLVTLKRPPAGQAQASAVHAVAARTGARPTPLTIPQLRVVGVRAARGTSLRALAARLRRDPQVADVHAERRFSLRYVPNDPAFSSSERGENGTVTEWWAAREGLPAAWDMANGDGARVAVIDTGADATHPDLTDKIVATGDFDDTAGHGPPTVDEDGHGTHVASLACAEPDNAIGIAGAGLGCELLIAKSDLSEGSVTKALIWAADNGADAINMSFGTDGRAAAGGPFVKALEYAGAKGAVLVAAAADLPTREQGYPANLLQPTDTGGDLSHNLGLTVTAANAADARAVFAGRGGQISMAAYGTYGRGGSPGLLAAFPAQATALERGNPDVDQAPCQCRTSYAGDERYAYLAGTSMSAAVVSGVAALMRHLNPDLPAADVVRILKQTARRPAEAWSPELGWGILDAGAAVAAARSVDAHAPNSQLARPKVRGRSILLRWRGADDGVAGVVASGIARFEVWRSANGRPARRIASTRAHSLRLRGVRGQHYGFFTIAIDQAGNREAPPVKADATVRVARR